MLKSNVYDVCLDIFEKIETSQILRMLFIHLRIIIVGSILKQMCLEQSHLRYIASMALLHV